MRWITFLIAFLYSCIGYGQIDSLELIYENDSYDTRWLSFGTNFQAQNSIFGINLSNGVDEEPLIHFEDFQDDILIKIYGQTDFMNIYSYGFEFGLYLLKYIGRTTIKYDDINLNDSDISLIDLNITSRLRYIRNTGLIFRTGYQELNSQKRLGFGLGIEQKFRNMYFGLNTRYFFKYFHHELYIQYSLFSKSIWSARVVYNRIDKINLLSVGLNYTFRRD